MFSPWTTNDALYARNSKRGIKTNAKSRYIGVNRARSSFGWYACIRYGGTNHNLGTYRTEIEAAKAYDRAAKRYPRIDGRSRKLNFPDA